MRQDRNPGENTAKKFAVYDGLLFLHSNGLRMKKSILSCLILIVALMAAAGCSTLSGSSAHVSSSRDAAGVAPAYNGYSLTQEKAVAVSSAGMPAPAASVPGQSGGAGTDTKIIRTADITLEVSDVPAAAESLKALAISQGGYMSSTSLQDNYYNRLTGTVVIRVPAATFDATIAGAKALGTVKAISTNGQDVTEEYVDLQAQKTSYTNQLAQYNAIMKQSTDVEDIIKVQEQIDRVQTELDRLNGRLNYLNSRIDISTITVYLQEPAPVGGQAGHDFVAAINNGIEGFFGMIDALIYLVFSLLPLIILGAIGFGIYRWHQKRKAVVPAPDEKK